MVVLALLTVVAAWLTLRGHEEQGDQGRSRAMVLLRRGIDLRDPATLVEARRAFLGAASGAWVRSEGLLLASVAEELRARVAGEEPDEASPGARDPSVRAALDLLAAGRYREASEVLARAEAIAPGSPTLRFHAALAAELESLGPGSPARSDTTPGNRQGPGEPLE